MCLKYLTKAKKEQATIDEHSESDDSLGEETFIVI